jgi:hypothetical protein
MALRHPEAVQSLHIAISLLALSGILEGGSLWVAWKQVKLNAKAANMTLRQYLHNGSGVCSAVAKVMCLVRSLDQIRTNPRPLLVCRPQRRCGIG